MADPGLVGNALSSAALGYFKGLFEPSLAEVNAEREEKARKAVEDRLRVESQRKLDEAQALWMGRRQSSTGRDRFKILTDEQGNQWKHNLDTGESVDLGMKRYNKPLTPQQQFDMDQLSNIEKYFGKPHTEITPQEWNDPAVRDTVDLLRKRQVIYATATGFALAKDLLNASPGVPIREKPAATTTGTAAPAPAPAAAAAPPPPPAKDTGTGKAVPPAVLPEKPPPAARPGGPTGVVTPSVTANFKNRWLKLGRQESDKTWGLISNMPAPDLDQLASAAQGYYEAFGAWPPGWNVPGEVKSGLPPSSAAAPVPPSETGKASPAAPLPGATDATSTSAQPTGDVKVIQTGPQAEQQQQSRDAARIKTEQEERAKKAALAGKVTEDQSRLANDYFARGVPGFESGYFPLLGPAQQKQINDDIQRPIEEKRRREAELFKGKQRAEHLKALKMGQPYIDELQAMKTTRYLSELVLPLVREGTIGLGGGGATIINTLASWLPGYKSKYQQEAEKQLRAKGVQGALTKAQLDTQVAAMVEGNAKELNMESFFSPAASLLEVYTSILAYGHALTIKRRFTGGAGAGRAGITVQDLKEAHAWFDPRLWKTNPDMMFARIQGLQTFIQEGEEGIKNTLRTFYLDPDAVDKKGNPTYPLLPWNPASAQELERPSQSTAPAPSTEDMDLLKQVQ